MKKKVLFSSKSKNKYLFDVGGGADFGYSLRKINKSYNEACIRVRRTSDNQEQDIGFVGIDLDTASLLAFVGNSDGQVNIWYDQSGNGLDLDRVIGGNGIRIVIGGVLQTFNGKPCMNYHFSYFRNLTPQSFNSDNFYNQMVMNVSGQDQTNPRYMAVNGGSTNIQLGHNSSGSYFTREGGITNLSSTGIFNANHRILTFSSDNNIERFNINNVEYDYNGTGAPSADSFMGDGIFVLRGYEGGSFYPSFGIIQEVVFYKSSNENNKSAIIENTNNYFNIF